MSEHDEDPLFGDWPTDGTIKWVSHYGYARQSIPDRDELMRLMECPDTELNAIIAQYELEMECEDIAEEMAR